jgi:hypothetical protein
VRQALALGCHLLVALGDAGIQVRLLHIVQCQVTGLR